MSTQYDNAGTSGVTVGYFTLTDEQRACDIEVLRATLGVISSGGQIMARFFAAVLAGENVLGFDLIKATRTLGETDLAQIQHWLYDPLFP